MKTHLLFSALGLMLLMTACQKGELPTLDTTDNVFAPPASDRCGCLPPVALETDKITNVSALLLWDAMPESVGYRIEVARVTDRAAADNFSNAYVIETAGETELALTNLTPNTHYKYRVTTICRVMDSFVSPTAYFHTKAAPHGDPGIHLQQAHRQTIEVK